MAFTPWVAHTVHEGRCQFCGVPVPDKALVGERAYRHEGVGWLTHPPSGRTVLCGGTDGSGTRDDYAESKR